MGILIRTMLYQEIYLRKVDTFALFGGVIQKRFLGFKTC